ncbi:hypothetical protein D7I44_08765 [Gryllotalpicola protaetiae]|uniref:Uncharacterized protein n=1 Tax=Gryllotalpicola protaetiae TaxID=2419771 RepID=A0A387BRL0_9MICO|nr:hypothetical protein D7I44_08765 [Gryllotalpicola protaetiae]
MDLAPLAAAAADYRQAIGRLEDASADAEAVWTLLPAALDSPGTQLAVGRFVGPAHQLSMALLQAADALHGALLAEVQPLRQLEAQAAQYPDDPSWQTRIDTAEASCAVTIAAIRGGESGSVDLPCPEPQAPLGSRAARPAGFALPLAPTAGLPAFGGALIDGATAAGAATLGGLLGALGLVLSMGGSSDEVAAAVPKRRRPGPNDVEGKDFVVTPFQPCDPDKHGDGCEPHLLGDKPGTEPFDGDKVKGNEEPGEMPGTESGWVKTEARNGHGWVYRAPDGRSMRVMEPARMDYDRRYPYGYVIFEKPGEGVVNLEGLTEENPNLFHIVRNRNGSFPMPEGWTQ